MSVIEIKKDIYWVGIVDWNLHDFHGYSQTKEGTTYNAYLVLDEKITLFDTVPEKFKHELVHQISKILPLEKIDYIVCNHAEPDHAGALDEIIRLVQPEKLFCSPLCKKALETYFHKTEDWPLTVVKTGDSISLGKRTVQFMETRMLHWPDSMFSYLPEDKLLISNDAFGQNITGTQRFDDEVDLSRLLALSSHYYHNIILPYSDQVQKVLKTVKESGMEIDMIAPDHGVIWRSYPEKILAAYDEYSRQPLKAKAVIVYDTMWHSTEKMAKAIGKGLLEENIEYRIMDLKAYHHSDVMAEVAGAAAIICGSPTHNNSYLPLMADFLTYMKGLRPKNRLGAAFGSFGWSGEAVKHMSEYLAEAGLELVGNGIRAKHLPTHAELIQCKDFGCEIGKKINEKVQAQG